MRVAVSSRIINLCQLRKRFLAPIGLIDSVVNGNHISMIEDYSHMDRSPNKSTCTEIAGVPSPNAKYAIEYLQAFHHGLDVVLFNSGAVLLHKAGQRRS